MTTPTNANTPAGAATWATHDKSGWGPGPWQAEPDKVHWTDPDTTLDCLAVRNRFGAWCGYVGVPPGHPWHGRDYDDVPADVHYGLTYAATCQEGAAEGEGICHVPAPGRPVDVWWLGFDCAHAFDYSPALDALRQRATAGPALFDPDTAAALDRMGARTVYRDLGYVVAECTHLAAQAAQALPAPAATRWGWLRRLVRR
ncbi:MAG: hypothetical protein ACRDYV_00060 [Acidimicrobiia bacterium]